MMGSFAMFSFLRMVESMARPTKREVSEGVCRWVRHWVMGASRGRGAGVEGGGLMSMLKLKCREV